MNGIDVARDPTDQIAGALLIVKRKRQPLNMGIDGSPEIVGDPLPNARGEVFFCVGADGIQHRNCQNRNTSELEHGQFVSPEKCVNTLHDPRMARARTQHIIQNNFQRPGLEQICRALTGHRKQSQQQ